MQNNNLIPVNLHVFTVRKYDIRAMSTLTHVANNTSIENNNQNGSWRVPNNL